MAVLREIKRRVKTAKNIGQVTRAMEMVSAVKMKRAQVSALSGRPYARELEKMISHLASQNNLEENKSYLILPKTINKVVLLVIAPKKGLCGGLISNLTRTVSKFIDAATTRNNIAPLLFSVDPELSAPEISLPNLDLSFVTYEAKSRKIAQLMHRPILADFHQEGKQPAIGSLRPIANFLVNLYTTGQADLILIAYSHFQSTVSQKAVIRQFLPVVSAHPITAPSNSSHAQQLVLYEPSAKEVLDSLIVRYCEAILYQIILESQAAEHSARMIAMKNAHDNAQDIVSELSLYYNKARQNAITSEISDAISAGLATG